MATGGKPGIQWEKYEFLKVLNGRIIIPLPENLTKVHRNNQGR
jgi:hypothetical protein